MQLSFPLILASGSPRRRQLLQDLGFSFVVAASDADESFDPNLEPIQVPSLLAERKAMAVWQHHTQHLVLAADTVVDAGSIILNKPQDAEEAIQMLELLSGRDHFVHTGISLVEPGGKIQTLTDSTIVRFRILDKNEIRWYVEHYKPWDKAGAYGIQEWIGMIGVEKMEGSYFTVMGLPTHKFWDLLLPFATDFP